MITTKTKPQVIIDLGLLDKVEAANYLGIKLESFNNFSGKITSIKRGKEVYYDKKTLQKFVTDTGIDHDPSMANVQQTELASA